MDPAGLGRKFRCQFIDAIRSDGGEEGRGGEGRLRFVLIRSDNFFTRTTNSLIKTTLFDALVSRFLFPLHRLVPLVSLAVYRESVSHSYCDACVTNNPVETAICDAMAEFARLHQWF